MVAAVSFFFVAEAVLVGGRQPFGCWISLLVLVECCQPFVAKAAFWCSSSDSHLEYPEVRLFQMVSLQWLEPSDSVSVVVPQMFVSEVDHWSFGDRDLSHRSHRQKVSV